MSTEGFSHSVVVRDVPADGRNYLVEANEEERRRVAEALGIPEVKSLRAEIEVRPVRGRAYSVRGLLNAVVVQTDVVTLELLTQAMEEPIDVTLVPANEATAKPNAREILVDAEEADGPDVFHKGRIDLGLIAAEHLALGLDPYPKAPDAAFSGYIEDDPASDASPFALLAGLNQPGGRS